MPHLRARHRTCRLGAWRLAVLLLAGQLLGASGLVSLGGCARQGTAAAAKGAPAGDLAVRRGDLRQRLLLTGELTASRAVELTVPRTNPGQLQIRWLAQDGTPVAEGDRVLEFDNSQFTSALDEKRVSASQAEDELARATAEAATAAAEKAFAVRQREADLEKARIQAAVPAGLLAERERQDRQQAFERARLELDKAREDLAAQRQGSAADLAVQKIAIAKSRREIDEAERAIGALVVRAPRAGIALIADHPWEGRKLREGDGLWMGMTVARIPELSSLEIEADLSDVDDGRVEPGMPALCSLDAYPGLSFPARVVEVSPVAKESARSSLLRSFTVRLHLARLDPQRMQPGVSVKVEVLGAPLKGVLLAPRAGLDLGARPPRALLAGGGSAPVAVAACDARDCAVTGVAAGTLLRRRDASGLGVGLKGDGA